MKIKLEDTTLVDKDENPIPFFHSTLQNNIQIFSPLSHFGTKKASNMRAMHFMYHLLGKPQPDVLPDMPSESFLSGFIQMTNLPPLCTYCVYLYSKNPLRIPDLGYHSFEQYYHWFKGSYKPKQKFLSPKECLEADRVGIENIKYKTALSQFIFIDPFSQTKENLEKEILSDSLCFCLPFSINSHIPSFLDNMRYIRAPFELAKRVAIQRLIHFLEDEGYDAFVYKNQFEDQGQDSYIIFRPEQVFGQNEVCTEHVLPQKDSVFLKQVEKRFFDTTKFPSPSERIRLHDISFKQKNKKIR